LLKHFNQAVNFVASSNSYFWLALGARTVEEFCDKTLAMPKNEE
jgi:hypothetical protein